MKYMLLLFLTISIVVLLIMIVVSWVAHIYMTRDCCDTYGWGSRKLFWKYFKEYELERDSGFGSSYFNRIKKSQVHAGIIQFNNIGMTLNIVDYVVISYELYRSRSIEDKRKIYKWK